MNMLNSWFRSILLTGRNQDPCRPDEPVEAITRISRKLSIDWDSATDVFTAALRFRLPSNVDSGEDSILLFS